MTATHEEANVKNELADHLANYRNLMEQKAVIAADLKALDAEIAPRRDALNDAMFAVDNEIVTTRAETQALLEASGETSFTDPATRFNARIEQRTSWKVTNKDDLYAAAKERPELGLLIEVADEKKAIALSKDGPEPLPGVECVTTETFAIHPPKEKK